jgi:hypothetical protein
VASSLLTDDRRGFQTSDLYHFQVRRVKDFRLEVCHRKREPAQNGILQQQHCSLDTLVASNNEIAISTQEFQRRRRETAQPGRKPRERREREPSPDRAAQVCAFIL